MVRENFIGKEKLLLVTIVFIFILSVSYSMTMANAAIKESLNLESVQLNYIPPEGMVNQPFDVSDKVLVSFWENMSDPKSARISIRKNPLAPNVNDVLGNINAHVQDMGKYPSMTISPVEKIKIGGQEAACVDIFEKFSNLKDRRCDILLDGTAVTFEYGNAPENFDKVLPVFQEFMAAVEIKSLSVKAEGIEQSNKK